ncbi:nodulation protein NodH [Actibacterium ureilyticum]|uniref:nodulation protein NodH n=1 Tax=Actibacterium ureilyticum TaxID=1590614 RepID=UPI000BAAF556|nr:nodulation protein NodH [Actibacterium ureilyticum]
MGFDSFVILAGMRTGSNLLESQLNAVPGLCCYGEAFNPNFVGYPKRDDILGITRAARDADPLALLRRIQDQPGVLAGFRYFRDHDPRVLAAVLDDPRCAKILLTRNPVDSFISLQIARATGQWKLTDGRHRRAAQITFDPAAFETYLQDEQAFFRDIRHGLQTRGQTAFSLGYDDVSDAAVVQGLVRFLDADLPAPDGAARLKRQNPETARDKVSNPDQMEQAVAAFDWAGLDHTVLSEPGRGASIRRYVAAAKAPVLFAPLPGGPVSQVEQWLAALDDAAPGDLRRGFTQKTLRQWKRQNPGHRTLTVVSHPLARAYRVFCTAILPVRDGPYAEIRAALRARFDVPLPATDPGPGFGPAQQHAAFLGFLRFLKANLAGQTNLRVDAAWASQGVLLQGMAGFVMPDMVVRHEYLARDLAVLAQQVDRQSPPVPDRAEPSAVSLSQIHDDALESAARAAYQRDYMLFGYQAWAEV